MIETYQATANALDLLVTGTKRQYLDDFVKKTSKLHTIYLVSNPNLYSQEESVSLGNSLESMLHKFIMSAIALEQLWAISHNGRAGVWSALENNLSSLDITDNELLLSTYCLENFLLQANAFLRFHMIYVCYLLKVGMTGHMSIDKFQKQLRKVDHPVLIPKANRVQKYFAMSVFGTTDQPSANRNDWGSQVKSLRDKISHRDRIRTSFQSTEFLLDEIRFNWPTLQGQTYDRFCQKMQDGMFMLFVDLAPIVYERNWVAGEYHDGLWEN